MSTEITETTELWDDIDGGREMALDQMAAARVLLRSVFDVIPRGTVLTDTVGSVRYRKDADSGQWMALSALSGEIISVYSDQYEVFELWGHGLLRRAEVPA